MDNYNYINKKINLLILAKSLDGGTGTFFLNFAKIQKLFNKISCQIKFLALERPSFRKLPKTNHIIFFHNKSFYPYNYRLSFKNIKNFIDDLLWLKKHIVTFNPSIILGVDLYSNLMIQILKVFFFIKSKTILCVRINLSDTFINKSSFLLHSILNIIVGFFYNRATAVICTSKQLANETYKNFGLNKIPLVIYNGLRSNNKNLSKKIINKNYITIVSIGRLVEQKDFYTLIKAFSLVKKKIPKVKLLIVGDGPLKKELMSFSASVGLKSHIGFLGWKNNINPIFKKSDLFVLSSKREGFGWVLIEAMAAGLPVVSTDAPFGPKEILGEGKYGVLTPVANEKKMSKAILNLLNRKEKYNYYVKKALERSKYYSLDKMLITYKNLILDLINKNDP